MNGLHIRDARESDRDTILDVTLSAYQEYAAIMPPPHWEDYRRGILATLADVRPAEQIVAEKEGAIDFHPAEDVIIKGYRLNLEDRAS
jgi:hypothetical protein